MTDTKPTPITDEGCKQMHDWAEELERELAALIQKQMVEDGWRSPEQMKAIAQEALDNALERAEQAEAELAALRLELARLDGEIPYGN